jgi:hypothetical protein
VEAVASASEEEPLRLILRNVLIGVASRHHHHGDQSGYGLSTERN